MPARQVVRFWHDGHVGGIRGMAGRLPKSILQVWSHRLDLFLTIDANRLAGPSISFKGVLFNAATSYQFKPFSALVHSTFSVAVPTSISTVTP